MSEANCVREVITTAPPVTKMATLRLELRDFKFLTKATKRWPGKKLRFTFTWKVDFNGEEIGQDIEGCLATVSRDGFLVWATPQTRSGAYYNNIVWNSPALHERIRTAIVNSGFTKHMGPLIPSNVEVPTEVDENLPTKINVS